MYYRATPSAAGNEDHVLNAPLTSAQADGNIKNLSGRVSTLETEMAQGWLGLDPTTPFTITGVNLYAKLTNGYTYGPYPIPQVGWRMTNPPSSQWQPDYQYYKLDAFNHGVTLYLVMTDHVSAATFDPLANDGSGNYYYGVLLDVPAAQTLPPGGTTGQALTKNTGLDYDAGWSTIAVPYASPSASAGLSAVAGSASTAMRSDAAPAISQSIVPTWTGLHTFNGGAIVKGTTTSDNAAAGMVGEYIESAIAIGTNTALTTATATNLTSVSLTAGDWDVGGNIQFGGAATTTVTYLSAGLSDTSATLQSAPTSRLTQLYCANGTAFASLPVGLTVGPVRFSLAAATTIYLVGQANFSVSTAMMSGGHLWARRRR